MRPKPVKSKARSNPPKDIHRGYELIGSGGYWQAFSVASGSELWDSGFTSRENAVKAIDDIVGDDADDAVVQAS